jgi:hypothetical protein
MIQPAHVYQRSAVLFVWILLACFSVSAQELSSTTSRPVLSLPGPTLLPLRATFVEGVRRRKIVASFGEHERILQIPAG